MHEFVRDGLTFPVADSGGTDAPAVVLLHGFPQEPSCFDPVVALLHRAGLRTLVPAQRGYVASARPTRRADYRLRELTADVVGLLDAAGIDRAHVVGHDWGGSQAWALGASHPDRVASLTALSTPHPAAFATALTASTQGLRSWYMAFFQLPALPEAMVGRTLARTLRRSGLPESHVERYAAAMDPGTLTGALNWYRGIPFSGRPNVGRVWVPTTYVWGRHDFALGRAAAERTARYVSGPYRFVDLDAGHWLPETQPDAVAEAVLEHVRTSVAGGDSAPARRSETADNGVYPPRPNEGD